MKKISFLALCLMALGTFGFVSSAQAEVVFTTSGSLAIGTAAGSNDLTVGLSPKVYAKYANDGTTAATAQWFAIAAAHPGGNTIYGTSQDVNNIYQKAFLTGTTIDTSAMTIPLVPGSAAAWTATLGYRLN